MGRYTSKFFLRAQEKGEKKVSTERSTLHPAFSGMRHGYRTQPEDHDRFLREGERLAKQMTVTIKIKRGTLEAICRLSRGELKKDVVWGMTLPEEQQEKIKQAALDDLIRAVENGVVE